MSLRHYQTDVADQVERLLGTAARPLIVAPTGSAKTIIGAEIINRVVARGDRVLVIAHTREIIHQTADKLIAAGVTPGIVLAGCESELRPMAAVQVASIQTLNARAIRSNRMAMPAATLLVIDEAHHARARTYSIIMRAYPDATIIGLTATPVRGDGRGLGNIFDRIIETPQIPDLIPPGYLVDCIVYAPVSKDIAKGVRISQGDYAQELLGKHMNRPELVGAIIPHWFKHAGNQRTICFAAGVDHSIAIVDQFVQAGVIAEHIDGKTPKEDRDAVLARLASGETKVVSNFGVLTEGWDCPAASVCILARPTKRMGLFRQMVGRVLRPDPATGKTRALLLDHAGATWNHGFITDRMEWTLHVDKRAENESEKKRAQAGEKLRECPQCQAVMIVPPCSQCGWKPAPRRGEDRDYLDEELGLVTNGNARAAQYSAQEREQWHGMLAHIAGERGYKPGWIAHKFKEKFGHWPTSRNVPAIEPTPEVKSWVRSRNIAYAKRQAAQP